MSTILALARHIKAGILVTILEHHSSSVSIITQLCGTTGIIPTRDTTTIPTTHILRTIILAVPTILEESTQSELNFALRFVIYQFSSRRRCLIPSSSWIERGLEGRTYYVKEKPCRPSLRRMFSDAWYDICRSRNPFLRDSFVSHPSTNADSPAPAAAHGPGETPAPRPKPALKQRKEQTSDMLSKSRPATPNVKKDGQPQVYHFTDHPPFPAPPLKENIGVGVRAHTPGQTTHRYAFPQARMYPYIPPGMQPIQQPVARQEPGPSSHGAAVLGNAATPFSYPHYPYPSNQGQAITNPVAVHPDDLKYKCTICGKFRSSRYQWKHRVPPGQLPRPTICKNCRAEATDSEDEDTDSYEERDYRHRAKGRKKSSRIPIARSPPLRSRARSISRASRRDLSHDYHTGRHRYDSSLDSTSSDEERRHRARSRKRRPQSDSAEIVRYVDVAAVKPKARRKKKVVYIEDRSRSSEDEGESEIEYIRVPSR